VEKKIFRDCTDFACFRDRRTKGMYDRKYAGPQLMAFLSSPESIFDSPHAIVLKAGRSSTVIKVTLDNRELVIKRHNLKNFWHWSRRMLRSTRAFHSWRLAQKLRLFGVTTARPVTFIEKS